jgi:hypothetical protein
LYPVLFITAKESQSICKINLWPFGSDCLFNTFQCSVLSPELRFLIHVSSSSWVWATLSLVLRATLTGLGRFLTSVAFSLAPCSQPVVVNSVNKPLSRLLVGAYINKCASL